MKLGVQYYRPPFPVQKHWISDLKRIRDSGFNTLQLWVTWAWVESQPGVFNFDDYDRLVEMAHAEGLNVLLSTIAELHPHWIHHEIPGSEMINNYGHRVVSSLREESNFGLTPGGCTENPEVWKRMADFLTQVVTRYRSAPHLAGWDAWNELRWHEQGDALVCFCPHCLAEFRQWLDRRHGGLDGLNRAWLRRYHSWEEVLPGKVHWRPFTEMMAWQRFVTWKANRHGKRRYDLIKSLDPHRLVTVHAGDPSPITSGWAQASALDRGNDWHYADDLDGVGCSSFPKLSGMDDTGFTTRVEFVRSAAICGADGAKSNGESQIGKSVARRKKLWLSEVQGGRGSLGFQKTVAVTAAEQQRWIWRGFASGAEKLLFWCWRDEVFGRESAGFGLAGNDGLADERLAAMKQTAAIFEQHRELLNAYEPDEAGVGVLFSPSSYYLHWALEGSAEQPRKALEGYCRALVHQSVPYVVVEEEHIDLLLAPACTIKTLFLPRMIVASENLEEALAAFVHNGGTLVCESECGAFNANGFYREPAERFFSRLGLVPSGSHEVGRRDLSPGQCITLQVPSQGAESFHLAAHQWLTPWQNFPSSGKIWTKHSDGVLAGEFPVGDRGGRVIHIGTYLGEANHGERSFAFERWLAHCLLSATNEPPVKFLAEGQGPDDGGGKAWFIKTGRSGQRRLALIFAPLGLKEARLSIHNDYFATAEICDLISGRNYMADHTVAPRYVGRHCLDIQFSDWQVALLVESDSAEIKR